MLEDKEPASDAWTAPLSPLLHYWASPPSAGVLRSLTNQNQGTPGRNYQQGNSRSLTSLSDIVCIWLNFSNKCECIIIAIFIIFPCCKRGFLMRSYFCSTASTQCIVLQDSYSVCWKHLIATFLQNRGKPLKLIPGGLGTQWPVSFIQNPIKINH